MIPLFKPYMPMGIMPEVEQVLYSGHLAFGKNCQAFESTLNQWLGTSSNAVVVSSYWAAMEIALNVFGIDANSEVIMSPMGCLRSSQPVVCRGARVVWADVDSEYGVLSPESVRTKITAKTKLIINYHHLGYLGFVDAINALGKEFGIPVLEDCLDGIGGEYHGKKAGTLCDAAVISFDAVRLPNAIEGGAVVFQNSGLADKARLKRDLGVNRKYYRDENNEIYPGCDISMTGYACTLNDVNALIALQQMPELDRLLKIRRDNAAKWTQRLSEKTDCRILKKVPGSTPNYWVYGVLTDKKMELLHEFREQGYFASGIHLQNNHYSVFHNPEVLPGVEDFHHRFLALPSGWWCEL